MGNVSKNTNRYSKEDFYFLQFKNELAKNGCLAYLDNQRCGPHLSFVEPFVIPQHFPEAIKILKEGKFEIEIAKATISWKQ